MTGGDMYALLLLQHTTDRSDITEHKSICGPCKGAQSSGIRRRYGFVFVQKFFPFSLYFYEIPRTLIYDFLPYICIIFVFIVTNQDTHGMSFKKVEILYS